MTVRTDIGYIPLQRSTALDWRAHREAFFQYCIPLSFSFLIPLHRYFLSFIDTDRNPIPKMNACDLIRLLSFFHSLQRFLTPFKSQALLLFAFVNTLSTSFSSSSGPCLFCIFWPFRDRKLGESFLDLLHLEMLPHLTLFRKKQK